MTRRREESVNTAFAFLLNQLGVGAEPESITPEGRPDVIFSFRGLRIAIEGKFDDVPNAKEVVLDDACARINRGLAHISVAAIYPARLRTVPFSSLMKTLASASIAYQILSEAGETNWMSGTPEAILASIRRAQQTLAQDDIVEKAAEGLSARLNRISKLWGEQAATCDRLSKCLGISIPKEEEAEKRSARRETAAKVSALIVANALIFQEQLRTVEGVGAEIAGVGELEHCSDAISVAKKQWHWIWSTIDYVPIFQLAEQVLNILPPHPSTKTAFAMLLDSVREICANQAALRHDLMGRIYHWLLHDAKYLGTYYTSGSAATLLLSLTLRAEWNLDFGNLQSVTKLKIGDLACGTGTLLMASSQALTDAYIRDQVKAGTALDESDLDVLHRALIEDVLHGYDVLPAAVHLTASTLAMLSPSAAFKRMNLNVMPIGVDHSTPRLGSLDFLSDAKIETQIALDNTQLELKNINSQGIEHTSTTLPKLDLCVMNPPFVRSVGGNLLFGSLEDDEREKLQKELKKRVKKVKANITAGLGSVFVAIADKHLKDNGRLAFVLPAALASGEAWGETRSLISEKYHLETVVVSYDPERANFSENTSLSEILFIARKKPMLKSSVGEKPKPLQQTLYLNLSRNPRSIHEAMEFAEVIHSSCMSDGVIAGPSGKIGECARLNSPEGTGIWKGSLFAQAKVLSICVGMENGKLLLPGAEKELSVALCKMGDLGALGPDRKRIHEGFKVKNQPTSYPALWGNESALITTIAQKPNSYLDPWTDSPRGPKYGDHLWKRAGRILLVERLRTNTHRTIAVLLPNRSLGNTWWALQTKLSTTQEKVLTLWLNSSLSILMVLGRRVVTEGAWMQMKQPAWESMPVLDVRQLSKAQLDTLACAYDRISSKGLLAVGKLGEDPVRHEIDTALAEALNLPDLGTLRKLVSAEPSLAAASKKKRTQQNAEHSDIQDESDKSEMLEVASEEIRAARGKAKELKNRVSAVGKRHKEQASKARPAAKG